MCCGKEAYEEVKEGRVGLTRRKVLRAMGVGTGLVALGGLTGCTEFLRLEEAANKGEGAITAGGTRKRELVLRELTGEARASTLQQVLADLQVQELKTRLEKKGHEAQLNKATVCELARGTEKGLEVFIPFTRAANLGFLRLEDQTFTMARINYPNEQKHTILKGGEQDQTIKLLKRAERKRIFQQIRKNPQYQEFEKELTRLGRVVLEEKMKMALDGTQKKVFIPILTAQETFPSGLVNALIIKLDPGDGGDYSGTVVYDTATSTVAILDPGEGGGICTEGFFCCMAQCLVEFGPEALALVTAACASCRWCASAPSVWNPSCYSCAACVVAVLGISAYCVYNCI